MPLPCLWQPQDLTDSIVNFHGLSVEAEKREFCGITSLNIQRATFLETGSKVCCIMGSTLYEEDINSVLKALRGQSIVLPDLTAILDGWPRETHAKLGQLRQDVDQWLDRYDVQLLRRASREHQHNVLED